MSLNNQDNNIIGNSLEDFELLTILGEGGFGKVIKVRSLKNQQIYAMKTINLEENEDNKAYMESEIEMLKKLNHQNIVKYYTSFQIENQLYIIMEYLDFGDLNDYINLLINISKNNNGIVEIKKGEIILIFLQCINALKYLKYAKVIHRDIKPENIFLSKKQGIKLGDFGVAAILKDIYNTKLLNSKFKQNENTIVGSDEFMSPEVNKGIHYDERADIYSMGLIFYKIYFLKDYRKKDFKIKDNKVNITFVRESKPDVQDPLIDLIFSMIEEDFNRRPDIDVLYERINRIYFNYFSNNNISSFYSVIRCLCNFPYLKDFFRKKFKLENQKFSEYFYNCIISQKDWNEALIFFKEKFYEENDYNFFEFNKRIKAYLILNFILEKMHMEFLDKADKKEKISLSQNKYDQNLTEKYKKDFSNFFNSKIANNFSCIMSLFYQCLNCQFIFNNYSNFFSLSFDIELFLLNQPNQQSKINIEDLFKYQNSITLIPKNNFGFYCVNCKQESVHREKKMFYYLPYCFIINFEYNDDKKYSTIINIPDVLDLSVIEKRLSNVSAKKYNLIGIIKNINGHYISIIFDYEKGYKWYLYDNDKMMELISYKEHKSGRVEMLFYFSPDKK